jgi:hypothetical protein
MINLIVLYRFKLTTIDKDSDNPYPEIIRLCDNKKLATDFHRSSLISLYSV